MLIKPYKIKIHQSVGLKYALLHLAHDSSSDLHSVNIKSRFFHAAVLTLKTGSSAKAFLIRMLLVLNSAGQLEETVLGNLPMIGSICPGISGSGRRGKPVGVSGLSC